MSTEIKINKFEKARVDGIAIESNYNSLQGLIDSVKKGDKNPTILFIKSYEDDYDMSPSYFEGYDLNETKKLRDYLNNLIAVSELAINGYLE